MRRPRRRARRRPGGARRSPRPSRRRRRRAHHRRHRHHAHRPHPGGHPRRCSTARCPASPRRSAPPASRRACRRRSSRAASRASPATLVVNLPGSRGGVKDGLAVARRPRADAVDQLHGGDHTPRPPGWPARPVARRGGTAAATLRCRHLASGPRPQPTGCAVGRHAPARRGVPPTSYAQMVRSCAAEASAGVPAVRNRGRGPLRRPGDRHTPSAGRHSGRRRLLGRSSTRGPGITPRAVALVDRPLLGPVDLHRVESRSGPRTPLAAGGGEARARARSASRGGSCTSTAAGATTGSSRSRAEEVPGRHRAAALETHQSHQ